MFEKDFDQVDASLAFTMGDGGRTLRRNQARDVVEALIDLTRIYGTRGFWRGEVEVDGDFVGRLGLSYVRC